MNDAKTRAIIESWYHRIGFDSRYDEAFSDALDSIKVDPDATAGNYDNGETDGRKNFLYYLYFCEELAEAYREKGIPEAFLYDNLGDLPRWLDTWSALKGGLYLGELDWLYWHFSMKLFKIGRLQYCFKFAQKDYESHGIQKGDPYIDMHIPAAGPLCYEECVTSLNMAREFFAKYYPEFEYKCFMCHSWLLDESLSGILPENSNILRFQTLFDIVEREESDAILQFVLRWTIRRDEVGMTEPKTAFAKKVKELAMAGEPFYVGQGIIRK